MSSGQSLFIIWNGTIHGYLITQIMLDTELLQYSEILGKSWY